MQNILKIIFLASITIILLSACGQPMPDSPTAYASEENSSFVSKEAGPETDINPEGQVQVEDSDSPYKNSSDMVPFEGLVFVATTELDEYLWQIAGWQVSNQTIDTNNSEIPQDCTLYPHLGVSNQWIGSCTGYILIPRNGAKDIAVMITDVNGSTDLIQVAP
jgi:hypothetical protein